MKVASLDGFIMDGWLGKSDKRMVVLKFEKDNYSSSCTIIESM